jgi:hypothetical protein
VRLGLAVLLVAWAAAPWGGCERDPVSPSATPPSERAPAATPPDEGVLFLPTTRRLA